jgi:hypothetical protein
LPDVVVYETANIFVYGDIASVVLNTAPNSTGIDQEVEVNQTTTLITITQ